MGIWLIGIAAALAGASPAAEAGGKAATLEQRVLEELNRIRTAPDRYVHDLQRVRDWHDGNLLRMPGRHAILTREGPAAVEEALTFTARQNALPPFAYSEVLSQAAADHAAYLAEGRMGHDWPDGTGPSERVERRGGGPYVAEIISFGYDDAADVVRQFIVDDGVPDRGHRLIMFRPNYRYAGIACGPHRRYRATCVVTLAATPDGR